MQTDKRGEVIEGIAPFAIITTSAGVAINVRAYAIIVTSNEFEFYINADSANKMYWPAGLPLVINDKTVTITTTAIVTFGVQD
jgi:hypothetical protein